MLNLEITESDSHDFANHLCVNGQVLDDSYAYISEDKRITATVYSPDQSLMLTKYSARELASQLAEAKLHLGERPWPELKTRIELQFDTDLRNCVAKLLFLIDAEQWAGPFSLAAYRKAVQDVIKSSGMPGISVLERDAFDNAFWMLNGFGISILIRDPENSLQQEITHWIGIVKPLLEHTRAVLSEEVQRDTLVTLFNFPPALHTACEQYLLYFIQFLRDLGIAAEGDIRHRAGQVLFSVRPDEGAEALDRIREALDVYLQIPATPDLDRTFAASRDIAALQLQANVHHLRGQITLASAVLQAREAEIEALKISNYQYRQLIAASAEVNQISLLPGKGQVPALEEETLLDGIITVTPYEGKGFKVNLPAILRSLKRRMSSS